jgi:ribosomal protein S18 acetylase RimI-like enzyme
MNSPKIHIDECHSCNSYFKIKPPITLTPNEKNNVEKHPFIYYVCPHCNTTNQVNPYEIIKMPANILPEYIHCLANEINVSEVKLDLNNLTLDTLTSFTEQLVYINELNTLGDDYAILDILVSHKLVDIDMPNDFEMYSINCDGIHLGIIGTETYKKDPSATWISWTLVLPEFRNRSIGKKAFEVLANNLKNIGKTKICVDCESPDQNPGTIRFYEKLNFVAISSAKEFRKNNPIYKKNFLMYDQDIIMKLDL